jgi:hypothetical protein
MIRYRITKHELEQLIEAEVPGWLERAKRRTDDLRITKRKVVRSGAK